MNYRSKATLVFAFGFLCLTTLMVAPAVGQQQDDATTLPITVVHRPPSVDRIPAIGTLMSIQVELRNTFDIESKIRLVGSKDGRFIDIAFPRGALNSADQPTFKVEIPSPIAAMTYQFVIHQRDGSLSASERFVIKRKCIQNYAVSVPEDAPNAEFRREVSNLVSQAKNLERDTASLESSLRLLEQIKSSLAN
jgi:hypothetical protein